MYRAVEYIARRTRFIFRLSAWVWIIVFPPKGFFVYAAHAGDLAHGRNTYEQYCIVCHGDDGTGAMPGVKNLSGANGPLFKADVALLKAMREGMTSSGSGMVMPPKGGNPALTDQDLQQVLNYMRSAFGK